VVDGREEYVYFNSLVGLFLCFYLIPYLIASNSISFQFPSGIISLFRYVPPKSISIVTGNVAVFQFPSGIISLFHIHLGLIGGD